jgi:hypothetical protein
VKEHTVSDRPIPTSKLVPVAAACGIIAVAAGIGVPAAILVPIAIITVVWGAVMVTRYYLAGRKRGGV